MTLSTDPLRAFVWELRRAFRELSLAADRGLAPLGITAGDRAVLEFLARADGPASLSQLARRHAVSRQHIHQALRRLPNPAWIETSSDPRDGRVITVWLTPAGRAFWKRVEERDDEIFRDLAEALDQEELQRATDMLRKLRAILAESTEPSDVA